MINPTIEILSDKTFTSNEGCLSVPQMRGDVDRYLEIKVTYYNRLGEFVEQRIQGYSACTWQHEYDHLDGVLFPHRVKDAQSFTSWQAFHEFKQAAFADRVKALVAEWGA